MGNMVSKKNMFENNGHIHEYSPGTGADNSLESKKFVNYKSSVNLVVCYKISLINYFVTVFHIQTYR